MTAENPLRIAIVGFGNIAARGHLPTYRARADVRVMAIADPVAERRQTALELLPGISAYDSLESMLDNCSDSLDAIDICSPPTFHVPAIRVALQANKHVLCEKPLALRSSEACELIQLAQKHHRVLHPCHNYLFAPSLCWMITFAQSGQIGKPLMGSFEIYRAGHARGVPDWKPDWRRDLAIAGGGIVADHGPHMVYVAMAVMHGLPTCVLARTLQLDEQVGNVEDTALLYLDFEGARVQITVTWAALFRKSRFTLHCEKGEVVVDGDEVLVHEYGHPLRHLVTESGFDDASHSSWFQGVLDDFKDCVTKRRAQSDALTDALVAANVIEQVYHSNAEGGIWMQLRDHPSHRYSNKRQRK